MNIILPTLGKDRQKNTAIMNAGCQHANLVTTTCHELKQKIVDKYPSVENSQYKELLTNYLDKVSYSSKEFAT